MMKINHSEESKFLASLSIFKNLYDNKKNIYDVIAEFIKRLVASKGKHSFTVTELTSLLNQEYNFKIPEAVVNLTLKKFGQYWKRENDHYVVIKSLSEEENKNFEEQYDKTTYDTKYVIENLYTHIQNESKDSLSEDRKEEILNLFCLYILDEKVDEENSKYFSGFIVKNEKNERFIKQLNTIKEGVILYTGIQYNLNISEIGFWNTELTIFLNMEILFHAAGYNGLLYTNLFNDFFKLVEEINSASIKKQKNRIIKLRYFSDTRIEIEHYFKKAEEIVENKENLNPSKPAMKTIVDGCTRRSDIAEKQVRFIEFLKGKFILEDKLLDAYLKDKQDIESVKKKEPKSYSTDIHKYNVGSTELAEKLSEKFDMHLQDIEKVFKYLLVINILREGKNDSGLENIKYILLSGSSNFMKVALEVKTQFDGTADKKTVPLVTYLDFLTNKLWFKLGKGFGEENLPKSFNIITKAQIVLSSQLNNTVNKKFEELYAKRKRGELSNEEAAIILAKLKKDIRNPEEINETNIHDTIQAIDEEAIESAAREIDSLKNKIREGEAKEKNLELLISTQQEKILENEKKDEIRDKKIESLEKIVNLYEEKRKKRKILFFKIIKISAAVIGIFVFFFLIIIQKFLLFKIYISALLILTTIYLCKKKHTYMAFLSIALAIISILIAIFLR